jgi:hypothetical protein
MRQKVTFIKLKIFRTERRRRKKSSYDFMLFMFQISQQHFAEFKFVWLLDPGICKNTF